MKPASFALVFIAGVFGVTPVSKAAFSTYAVGVFSNWGPPSYTNSAPPTTISVFPWPGNGVTATLAGPVLTMRSQTSTYTTYYGNNQNPITLPAGNNGYILFDTDQPFTMGGSRVPGTGSSELTLTNLVTLAKWTWTTQNSATGEPVITSNLPSPAPVGSYNLSWRFTGGSPADYQATLTAVPEPSIAFILTLVGVTARRSRCRSIV